MKIVHVLKRIETIDNDIKDLRKLEKILQKDKSFSTPIYMSIEKQINILLGERVKLLELKIANPPANLVKEFKDEDDTEITNPIVEKKTRKKRTTKKTTAKKVAKKRVSKSTKDEDFDDDIPLQILTQDQIDSKFDTLSKSKKTTSPKKKIAEKKSSPKKENKIKEDENEEEDENVKLLDIALEKGTLNKKEITKEKERVRFFRDNFPGAEY